MKKTMVKLLAITLVLAMFMGVGGSAFALEIPSSSFQLPTVKVREEEKPAPEQPAEEPTVEPTEQPAEEPTEEPTEQPTEEPTEEPAVEPTEEPVEEVPADAIGKGTVSLEDASSNLNVRAEGNSEGELLDKIANGEAVYILATEGGWTKIRTASGLEGWVASSYLSIEEAPAEEPVAEPTEEPTTEPTEAPTEEPTAEPAEEELLTEEELLEQPEAEDVAYADIDVSQLKVEIATTQGDVVMMGETITLTSVLTGFDGLTYAMQWQYDDGSGWKNVDGATGDSYSFIADDNNIYFQWRLEVAL